MKRAGLISSLIATTLLLFPPAALADVVCNYYWDRAVTYYDDGGYYYCGGWNPFGCTECANNDSGESCHANGNHYCSPGGGGVLNPTP